MKKLLPITIILSVFTTFTYGQAWEKLFSQESVDVFRCVQEVSSGGYILAGYTADSSANDSDAYVVRLNSNGDTTWTYRYNGAMSKKDLFYKIIETSSGDFIALGYTFSVTGISDDILYVKLTSGGNEVWVKTWGAGGTEHGQDIVETPSGYTIVGYTTPSTTYYDALILHTDFNGDEQWTNIVGGADYDDANSVDLLSDGGYIIGGQSRVGNNSDMFLMRTDSLGDTLWTKRIGTTGIDNIESITVVSNGFVLAGGSTGLNADNNGYIVKTDDTGNVLWTKSYGGSDQDDFHRIESTSDGGFILAGTCASYGGTEPNMWLFKTDANGDSSWAYTFGGDSHDHGYSAMQTTDGGYIVTGHSGSFGYRNEDGYVIKMSSSATPPNTMKYVRPIEIHSPLCSGQGMQNVTVLVRNFGHTDENNVQVTANVTGAVTTTLTHTISSFPHETFQVITFSQQLNTSPGGVINFTIETNVDNDVYPELNTYDFTINTCTSVDEMTNLDYSLYPNPASDKIDLRFGQAYRNLSISLINSNGAIVEQKYSDGQNESIDVSSLASGIYIVKVVTDSGVDVRRVIIQPR